MIVACIHCNWLAWMFLPLAIWVLSKIKKNHKCPCDECHDECHDEVNINDVCPSCGYEWKYHAGYGCHGSFPDGTDGVDAESLFYDECLCRKSKFKELKFEDIQPDHRYWFCNACKTEIDKGKDFSCNCKESPSPLIPISYIRKDT